MNACIITIGNEIIEGSRLDTNSQWIARQVAKHGIITEKIISIGDDKTSICDEILKSVDQFNFIFITGGLGPTHDDITLSSFQKVFNLKSRIDLEYLKILDKAFQDRGIKMPKINQNQGLVLDSTDILNNTMGTARGIHYKHSKSDFFIMPGVPAEMYRMMKEIIIPSYLGNEVESQYKVIRTSGIAESKLSEKIEKLMAAHNKDLKFSFLPSYKGVDFILKARHLDIKLNEVSIKFYNAMQPYSFGYDNDSFPEFIIKSLSAKNISISLAESCTGGLLGKILTDVPGSSRVFIGGIVAYNNSIKINQLSISKAQLDKHGSVSSEIAKEMACNIKNIFNSDMGLSITGISGPTGNSNDKNIGLVYIGIAFKDQCIVRKFNFNLNRDLNRKMSCYVALNIIKKIINE